MGDTALGDAVMLTLGIDPGLSGACAILHDDSMVPEVFDLPTLEVIRNKKRRREYQIASLVSSLTLHIGNRMSETGEVHAYVERSQAMPFMLHGRTQGVTSSFSMGRGLGILEGVLSALNIPYTLVAPATWKRAMLGGKVKQAKEASRLRAQQLFPGADLSKKRDHGKAEALLIAQYGRTHLA